MARISTHRSGGVTILSVQGKLTRTDEERPLRDALRDTLNSGETKIVLNLEGVSAMDEDGIGYLAASHAIATNHGAKLTLCCLPHKAVDILSLTRLTTVFDIHESEDDAVRSFG